MSGAHPRGNKDKSPSRLLLFRAATIRRDGIRENRCPRGDKDESPVIFSSRIGAAVAAARFRRGSDPRKSLSPRGQRRPDVILLRWLAVAVAVLVTSAAGAVTPVCPRGDGDFPVFYPSADRFTAALEATRDVAPWAGPVTGVTVPHHLLVPDLIAGGLRLAAGADPARIVVLLPDHFARSPRPFATSARGYDTVLGPVAADAGAVAALLRDPRVADSCLFATEHGLRALLPFLSRLYPAARIVPVAIAASATRADWDEIADRLAPLVDARTLIVQSTDFSHYLPHYIARQRDQQVLNVMAAGDLDAIAGLIQPDHVDSVGALYIQTLLQARLHDAAPVVVANRNLQEDVAQPIQRTTSYIVALYTPAGAPADPPPFAGSHVYMLGGDLFLGRAMPRLLADDLVADRVAQAALAVTRGLPLILNLEGVVLPDVPAGLPPLTLAMPRALLADWAARLRLAGLGQANNHAADMGDSGLALTRAALDALHLPWAAQGGRLDLPGVSLVMLTDHDGRASGVLTPPVLDRLALPDATRPVVAFVHWGREGLPDPDPRQMDLALAMHDRGVAAIVGAHPHVASRRPLALAGGDTLLIPSLGNFLFDQSAPGASGAVVELRTFAQGTLFLRQLPLPPLYDLARDAALGGKRTEARRGG